MVERTLIRPPSSQLGPITAAERAAAVLKASDMAGKYDTPLDRKSAYEILAQRSAKAAARSRGGRSRPPRRAPQPMAREFNAARRYSGSRIPRSSARSYRPKDTFASAMSQAVIKELKGTTGQSDRARHILGGLFKGR